MKTILKSLSRDYVAIYTDATDTSKFCVGSIAGLDNQYVLLKTVDEDGRDDGYTLRAIETIYAVEENTQYLSRITELSKRFVHSAMINLEGHPSMLDALGAYAQSEKEFVSVELNSSGVFDVSGYIFKANEEIWEICQVDSNGVSNGRIYVSKEAISRVDCGSSTEANLKYLNEIADKQ